MERASTDSENQGVYAEQRQVGNAERYTVTWDVWNSRDIITDSPSADGTPGATRIPDTEPRRLRVSADQVVSRLKSRGAASGTKLADAIE
jgi:hypothetical protein